MVSPVIPSPNSEFYRAVKAAVAQVIDEKDRRQAPSAARGVAGAAMTFYANPKMGAFDILKGMATINAEQAHAALRMAGQKLSIPSLASVGLESVEALAGPALMVGELYKFVDGQVVASRQRQKYAADVSSMLTGQNFALQRSQAGRSDYSSQDLARYAQLTDENGAFRRAMQDRIASQAQRGITVFGHGPGEWVGSMEAERLTTQQIKLKEDSEWRLNMKGKVSSTKLNISSYDFWNDPAVKKATEWQQLMEKNSPKDTLKGDFTWKGAVGASLDKASLGLHEVFAYLTNSANAKEQELKKEKMDEKKADAKKTIEKQIEEAEKRVYGTADETFNSTNRSVYQEQERHFRVVEEDRLRKFYQWNQF